MAAKRKQSSSEDILELMASFKDVVTVCSGDESDEIEIIKELKVSMEHHRCDLCCEGEFLVDRLLRFGGLINDKYRYVCDKCDKNFIHKCELTKHLPKCSGPVFNQSTVASENISSKEQPSVVLNCSTCTQTFKTQRGLSRHRTVKHSNFTHTCEICKKVFSNFLAFNHHCFQHERVKQFQYVCSTCNKRFLRNKSLQRHQMNHKA